MTAPRPPEPPPEGSTVFTRDPVRIVWVIYGFVQATLIVLIAAEVVSPKWSAIITGIALGVYVAVSELFVRKETVPRQPLEELAQSMKDNGHLKGRDS